jgi:hypothetical protein
MAPNGPASPPSPTPDSGSVPMGRQSKRHKQARHRQLIRGRVGSQTTADIVGQRGERMLPTEEGLASHYNSSGARCCRRRFFCEHQRYVRGWWEWGGGTVGRHGSGACAGRVGQDAQPRSCRLCRTAQTSKAPTSLQGWIYGVSRHPTPTSPSRQKRAPVPLLIYRFQLKKTKKGGARGRRLTSIQRLGESKPWIRNAAGTSCTCNGRCRSHRSR